MRQQTTAQAVCSVFSEKTHGYRQDVSTGFCGLHYVIPHESLARRSIGDRVSRRGRCLSGARSRRSPANVVVHFRHVGRHRCSLLEAPCRADLPKGLVGVRWSRISRWHVHGHRGHHLLGQGSKRNFNW